MRTYIYNTDGGAPVERTCSRAAARAWERQHPDAVRVDSWPADDPPPAGSDARAWDGWRSRRGYAGGR